MRKKRYRSSSQKQKLSAKLKTYIVSALALMGQALSDDDLTDEYVLATVDVAEEGSDLAKAQSKAIEDGMVRAFNQTLDKYDLSGEGMSAEQINQAIDGYTIHNEQIGKNFYKAQVEYRLNITYIRNKAKRRPASSKNEENTLIVVDTSAYPLNDQNNRFLCSVSQGKVKYRYNKQLDESLKKANVKVHYERID